MRGASFDRLRTKAGSVTRHAGQRYSVGWVTAVASREAAHVLGLPPDAGVVPAATDSANRRVRREHAVDSCAPALLRSRRVTVLPYPQFGMRRVKRERGARG